MMRIGPCFPLALLLLLAMPAPADTLLDVAKAGTEMREDDLPSIASASDGSLWLAWLSYSDRRDEIALRRYQDGTWGNLQFVPNTSGDIWLPQIAVDAEDRPWIVWSQQRDTNWDLYARRYDPANDGWGPLVRLTDHPLPDVNPRLATNGNGRLAVVWQGFRGKHSNIYLRTMEGGDWSTAVQVTGRPANDWEPAAAFDSSGAIWIAYDSYKNGNYDVYLAGVKNGRVTVPEMAVAETPRFETRATVAVDKQDRVWVAWEAGEPNWGKDTGFNIRTTQPGAVLGDAREARIACFAGGKLQAPAQPLQTTFANAAGTPKWTHQPHVFTDSSGNVRVAAKRLIRIKREGSGTRGYWSYWMTRYDGDRWTAATVFPQSWGRSSTRPSATRTSDGSLWLAWPTDNRTAGWAHRPIRGEVVAGRVAPTTSSAPRLIDPPVERIEVKPGLHPNEPADLDAIRGYRTTVAGRPVQIVRGDFHRHTELSWDGGGGNDGSLQDFYRYMIDAAAMDFGASTDHQGGAYDYWWWYSQKMTDMYHVPGAYVPIYGFERSITQPNGHRNIFYADRSGAVVPFFIKHNVKAFARGAHPQGDMSGVGTGDVVRDDTKHLYDEIRRMGGIAISHTSATRMGTDWRDNDPELEPVVEIFQGARTNYEYDGAPLAAKSPDPKDAPGRYVAAGFVRNAWDKGYRLGIIASSDHGSTHYSYAMVYTDRPTRQGILDAIRRRHTYGATDNILLDVRMGEHFMGDEFRAAEPLPISVTIRGTQEVEKVHVIRDGQIIYSQSPGTQDVSFEYTDVDMTDSDDTRYYYIRVEQVDKQVAWSSPFWVN